MPPAYPKTLYTMITENCHMKHTLILLPHKLWFVGYYCLKLYQSVSTMSRIISLELEYCSMTPLHCTLAPLPLWWDGTVRRHAGQDEGEMSNCPARGGWLWAVLRPPANYVASQWTCSLSDGDSLRHTEQSRKRSMDNRVCVIWHLYWIVNETRRISPNHGVLAIICHGFCVTLTLEWRASSPVT